MKRSILLVYLFSLICQTSCTSRKEEKEESTKFLVTNPARMDTSVVKDYVCQIHSIRHIELRSQERGYLEKIYIDEGQHVKAGQLLFQIMPKVYQAELQRAQAETQAAQIEVQNTQVLADKNVVSPNELALAKAKLAKAKAEVALYDAHLGFTQIRAPFDGIIDRFHVRQGSLLEEGDLLTELSDNSKMWVYYNVPEAEYLNYKSSAANDTGKIKVKLRMANNEEFEYPGIVETIEANFNNETGNISFRATFPNPKGLLRHGETGTIEMTVPYRNALIIPQKATFEVLEKKYVFVVDKNNVAHQKEVSIAAEMPDLYIVKGGVSEQDKILLEGIRKIKDNQKIDKFEFKDPKKAISELKVYVE